MVITPIPDKGLGNTAYLVGSRETKTAVVIDPRRDVDQYLAEAERQGVEITAVLETHLHADFISGARELAARAAARGRRVLVGASAEARLEFEHRALVEGERLELGELALEVLATPGHTPEHISFTVIKRGGAGPAAVFSGGALIVGGAARTDLLGDEMTGPLIRSLYHSMHHKLLAMADHVGVYPTHGAGSFCAAPSHSERTTTIGIERAGNPLARARSEAEFAEAALHGLPFYPPYFLELRPINRRGPRLIGELPKIEPLSASAVRQWMESGGVVLDTRSTRSVAGGYIRGAYACAADAPLVTWVGFLIPFGAPLVLVSEDAAERDDSVTQLRRIGYDEIRGYLDGGVAAWRQAGFSLDAIAKIAPEELRDRMKAGDAPLVLDVRSDREFASAHIPGARHIEVGRLPALSAHQLALPTDRPIAVHCMSPAADRAVAAISVLARRGFRNLVQLDGGFSTWQHSGFDVEGGSGSA